MDTPRGPRKLCRRYDEPWQAHYLTFSCYRRQPFFSGAHAPSWFIDSMDAARSAEPFDLWAFVIMPEHAHLLILPHEGRVIPRILWYLKKPVTYKAIQWLQVRRPDYLQRLARPESDGRTSHHFWQPGGGYDRNLWTIQKIYEKLHYIHANPVRRGLVESPGQWKWSSYRAWETGMDEPIRIDGERCRPWRMERRAAFGTGAGAPVAPKRAVNSTRTSTAAEQPWHPARAPISTNQNWRWTLTGE